MHLGSTITVQVQHLSVNLGVDQLDTDLQPD